MFLTISAILQVIILLIMGAVLCYSPFLVSTHPYFDGNSLIIFSCLCLALLVATRVLGQRCPPFLVMSFVLIVFVQLRLAVLWFNYDSFYLGWSLLTPDIMNDAVQYITLGIIACALGALGGARMVSVRPVIFPLKQAREMRVPLDRIFLCFLIVIGIHQLTFNLYGYFGSTGSSEHLSLWVRIYSGLINRTAAFWFALAACVYGTLIIRSERLRVSILLLIWLASLVLEGSRGGIFEVVLALLLYLVYFRGNLRLRVKAIHLLGGLLGIILAIMSYQLITDVRMRMWQDGTGFAKAVVDSIVEDSVEKMGLGDQLSQISYRLSIVEGALYAMHGPELGASDISFLVNPETTFYSTLNRLLPGDPFGEIIWAEHAYGFLFRREGSTYFSQNAQVNYTGYEWGMFGICYQLFSYWGGLLAILIISGVIFIAITFCQKRVTIGWSALGLFFLYTTNSWVHNLGLDNLFDRTGRGAVLILLYIGIYRVFLTPQKTRDLPGGNRSFRTQITQVEPH